jgi:hypothetical protein
VHDYRVQIASAGFAPPHNLRPNGVSTKGFGRPRAFRVEKARSAPIMSALRAPFGSARMRVDSLNERMR